MADRKDPMIGQDQGTQEMLKKAEEDFPNLERDEALQMEANKAEGREAVEGEGQTTTGGIMGSIKESVSEAVDTVKQMNPATRDMKEKHC